MLRDDLCSIAAETRDRPAEARKSTDGVAAQLEDKLTAQLAKRLHVIAAENSRFARFIAETRESNDRVSDLVDNLVARSHKHLDLVSAKRYFNYIGARLRAYTYDLENVRADSRAADLSVDRVRADLRTVDRKLSSYARIHDTLQKAVEEL